MELNLTHTLMFIDYSPNQNVINLVLNLLIVTFPADTAAPTEAKSVLAIFVQKHHKSKFLSKKSARASFCPKTPQERSALQQREHHHGIATPHWWIHKLK